MLAVAASFISGIAAFHFFPFFPVTIAALSVLITVLIFLRGCSVGVHPRRVKTPPINEGATCSLVRRDIKIKIFTVLMFISGFLFSSIRYENIPELILPEGEVSVEGDIIGVPELSNDKIRFILDRVSINGEKIKGEVRLFLPQGGAISRDLLTACGDRVHAFAKLKSPNMLHNPGVYSQDPKKDGIAAVGNIKQLRVVKRGKGLPAWICKERGLIGDIIDNSLSAEGAALHKALIPGLSGGISQEMRDAFSVTGLAHVLSISGTHFGLLAFIIFRGVKMTVKGLPEKTLTKMTLHITPTQTAVLITLPVLVFYAFISGMSTATVRSLIMIFIYMSALFMGRKDQWLNSLSIAAVIILLCTPDALFELSFQLSFVAVLSLGYVVEKSAEVRSRKSGVRSWKSGDGHIIKKVFDKTKEASFMSIAAVLGTAPIVALYFKQFPLISPLSNLIITPLVCFVILPLGFFGAFVSLLFNMPYMPLGSLTDAVTHFALWLIKMFSQIPCSNVHVPNPSFAMIFLYYFSLVFLIRVRDNGNKSPSPSSPPIKGRGIDEQFTADNEERESPLPRSLGERVRVRVRVRVRGVIKFCFKLLPLILVLCIYIISPYLDRKDFRITFLDIGQGDSAVVELPDKKVMLIDGGLDAPDMGREVVAPFLWSKGMRRIDYLVMTHPHPDHCGGLVYVMDNFKVGEVWLNGKRTLESDEFLRKMQQKRAPFKALKRGDALAADNYRIYAFHPYDEFFTDSPRGDFSNENSASLVLKIEANNASVLFTGDIETEAEEDLVRLGQWLRSDIIKVPHHGGRTSSSSEFLKAVAPQTAVVSAGKNNSYKHPHKETLERYKRAGIKLYRTDVDGAVTVTFLNPPIPPLKKGGNNVGAGFKPAPTKGERSYDVQTYWDSAFKGVTGWQDETRNLRLLFRPF